MLSTPPIPKATLLRITCVFWVVAKLICYKLWLADRLFPLVPVVDELLMVPGWVHMGLFVASLGLMGAVIVLPSGKGLQWALLTSEVASCLLDQNRWQPWEYQYLFTLFIMLTNKDSRNAFMALAFMLAATYVYSGLNKFTPGFLSIVWDSLILHGFFKVSAITIHHNIVYHSGYALGLIELMSGIGLFFKVSRKYAATALIVMHVFVLLLLNPFGPNNNTVVLPWNMVMIASLYLVFLKDKAHIYDQRAILRFPNILVLVCWGILPALCFAGWWDNYLSSNLYSGRQPYQMICVSNPDAVPALQPYMQQDKNNICNGQKVISVIKWGYTELKAPPYPEYRVLSRIEASFQQSYPAAGAKFITYDRSK